MLVKVHHEAYLPMFEWFAHSDHLFVGGRLYSYRIGFPMASITIFQKRKVNRLSLSEIMDSGTPYSLTISLRYVLVTFSILYVSLIGRKCVDLVCLSTITQMVSCPPDVLGNFVMKSMVIRSHFHLGISVCYNSPEVFWYSALTIE